MNRNLRVGGMRDYSLPGGLSPDPSDNGDFMDADDVGATSEETSHAADTPGTPHSGVSAHLGSYQTKEYRRLLDIIDEVRKFDINHVLQIPQIVVCGNTSAGKSSVLEAISHIKFPRGDNVCTRYVTEICLRTDDATSITVTISPKSSRPKPEQADLIEFKETAQTLDELPRLMNSAEKKMGLPRHSPGNATFTEDCLRIEVNGPDQPRLTLIDVPGLVQTGDQELRDTITGMTERYINNPRSIILAVLGAHDEPVNQSIFRMAREVDPQGVRTFGIITKPDKPDQGSGSQRNWIKIAQNEGEGFKFKNGWHVLLNRSEEEVNRNTSTQDRDTKEKVFFERPDNPWSEVPPDHWGAENLKAHLVRLLVDLLRRESSSLKRDIENRLIPYHEDLDKLAASLRSKEEADHLFRKKCRDMRNLTLLAVEGKFNDGYFELPDDVDYLPEETRYLRSLIEDEEDQFHEKVKVDGRSFLYTWNPDTSPSKEEMNRFLERVAMVLKHTRGHESEDIYDPQRLDLLFHKLSRDWQNIGKRLIKQAHTHCKTFLEKLMADVLGPDLPYVARRLYGKVVSNLLEERKQLALKELSELEKDRVRPAKTRNDAFAEKIQQEDAKKLHSMMTKALRKAGSPLINIPSQITELLDLDSNNKKRLSQAAELMTRLHIYYDIAANVFVDNVVVQVVERHLLRKFDEIFDEILDLERTDRTKWDALLLDPDYEERKETMKKVQAEADNLQKCLDAVEDIA